MENQQAGKSELKTTKHWNPEQPEHIDAMTGKLAEPEWNTNGGDRTLIENLQGQHILKTPPQGREEEWRTQQGGSANNARVKIYEKTRCKVHLLKG